MIILENNKKAFTQGGNRLIFFHPDHKDRCIKIVRPDRTPALRRKEKPFPKNLKPLSRFDENKNELNEINNIQNRLGDKAFKLIPRCYGLIETDLGKGLCLDLINDDDGKVSISLKQYLWTIGLSESLQNAIQAFSVLWQEYAMPSRQLLLHNIVVQQEIKNGVPLVKRLVVIDGLGWSGISFLHSFFPSYSKYKAGKRILKLERSIKLLLLKKKQNADWGYHGWLNEDQRLNK